MSGFSTVYYVSSSMGNDGNPGTSEDSAWRSLDKVNSFVFSPGDQVLFKRGDSWTGTLVVKFSGTAGNPIVYGAYGTGATPKIYGSEVISGWTLHSGNIYKARVNSRVTQLFVDGVRVKAARFPNDGYTHIETVNSTTSFSCDELDGNIDYTGAKWFGRTNDWTAVTRSVISSDSKRLTLDSEVEFGLGVGEGFILMNKLEFLDAAGEWFFDGKTNTVYLWTPKGDSPGNYEVRGSVYDDGVTIGGNRKYITIRDLEILEQTGKGIHMRLNTYVEVSNNILKNQEQYGLYCLGTSHNCSVTNNYVRGQNVRGIYFVSADSDVSGNHVEDIGLFDNIGINSTSSTLFGVGIDVYGNSPGSENTIRYNRIKRTGYTGLYFRGKSFIEFNSISYTCLVKDDGGGIYTPSSTSYNSEIRNNIVLHAIGSSDGLPKDTRRASGIYLDEPTGNIIVEHNTVAYCNGGGIFLHYNGSSQVSNNISYGNRYGLLASREWDTNIFRHNIVYALNISDEAEEHQILTRSHNGAKSVIYDHNTYIHHYNSTEPFRRTSMPESAYYDFEAWKETTNQDKNSTIDTSPLGQGETEELFYNDTKQSKTFDLGTTIYRDIYGTELSGKLTLEPFTSTILIKTTKTVQENQRPEIEGQSFHKTAPIEQNDFIGQVVASDPDADQSLVYSILQGNELNLFALNSTTGELTAHADIQPSEDQTYILTVEVTDNAEASLSASAEIAIHITGINNGTQEPDNTSPQISSFSIPSESNSLTVFIAAFEATDNLGVAGYQLTETEVSPSADSEGWASTAPGEYTFSGEGRHTLYAWVKDEAGNLSSAVSQSILITLPDMSPVYSEYLFEESGGMDVLDSECSNDGVIKNEGFRVDGAKGRGMEFSGKGYIGMGQCFGENVGDEVSMSAWVKPDRNSSGYQGIIMHGGPNTDTYALYLNPDTKTIGFKTSGTTSSWFAADNVDKLWDGNWHHLVAVYNGTEKVIYLDNTAIAEISAEGSIDSGYGYNLLVGAGRDEIDPTLLYEGLLDEVRVYNYALTNTEMGELYHPVNRELNKIYTAEDIVICEGENYMGWTEPGEYERVLQRKLESASGADSVVTTNLTVNPVYSVTAEAVICEGETYRFGSQTLSESGEYTEVFETIHGCDSTVVLTLTVNEKYHVSEEITIVEGEDYMGWTEEGIYERNLVSSAGCDSIIVTNLSVIATVFAEEDILICEGSSYNGWTESGRYERTLESASGADSVVTTNLTVNPVYSVTAEAVICEGETYRFGSQTLSESGEYTEVFETIHGCDSTVVLTLTVNEKYHVSEDITIVEGEDYKGWTEEGIYERNLVSSAGCDSIVVTNLSVIATANIGNTDVYGYTSVMANRRAQPVTFSNSGEIQSVSIYHNGGTGKLLLGVYSDESGTPSSLLGVTSPAALHSTEGWQTVSLTSPVFVNSGETVWLSWVFENNPGVRYTSGTPGRVQSSECWPAGMPGSFGSGTVAGYVYSVYCTYFPGEVPETANAGNTDVYGYTSVMANRRAQPVTFSEPGEIQSISIYHNGGTGKLLLGVYSDESGTPSSLLGVTSPAALHSTEGWQTVSLTSPVFVNSGETVWLSWVFENNPGVRYTSGTPGRVQSSECWTAGMPGSFGSGTVAGYVYSVYCTYTYDNNVLRKSTANEPVKKESDFIFSAADSFENRQINDFNLYPNPAESHIEIEFSAVPEIKTEIFILDRSGKILISQMVESASNRIEISHLPAGLYFVRSVSNQGQETKKLIVVN